MADVVTPGREVLASYWMLINVEGKPDSPLVQALMDVPEGERRLMLIDTLQAAFDDVNAGGETLRLTVGQGDW